MSKWGKCPFPEIPQEIWDKYWEDTKAAFKEIYEHKEQNGYIFDKHLKQENFRTGLCVVPFKDGKPQ